MTLGRNGIAALALRAALIALAAVMFGSAPEAPAGSLASSATPQAFDRYHSFAFFASATGSQAGPHFA